MIKLQTIKMLHGHSRTYNKINKYFIVEEWNKYNTKHEAANMLKKMNTMNPNMIRYMINKLV